MGELGIDHNREQAHEVLGVARGPPGLLILQLATMPPASDEAVGMIKPAATSADELSP